MIWSFLIIAVISIVVFSIFKSKPQSGLEGKETKSYSKNSQSIPKENSDTIRPESLHKDVLQFMDLIDAKSKRIELSLQNDYVRFIADRKTFKNSNKYQNRTKDAVKEFQNELGIDSDTAFTLFDSNHVDGEGPNLITDKSGNIFRYHFAEPSLNLISESIWDLISNKELSENLESNEEILHFDKQSNLSDYIDLDRVTKFAIHGFYVEDYKKQLEIVLLQSNGSLNLNSFEWEDFDWNTTEIIKTKLRINDSMENINIEKSKWYDFKFPGKINALLSNIGSEYRISLVHENSWDETHGILLTKKEEHEILSKKRLIIG